MSGTDVRTTDAPDVAELLRASAEAMGQSSPSRGGKAEYEVTAGGFASPGQDEPKSSPTPPPAPSRPVENEIILGAERTQETVPTPAGNEELEGDVDYDAIIAGLTGSAQAERKARQEIQAALAEERAARAEAQHFRERYEPHIKELTTLWPEIEKQSAELEETKKREKLQQAKLELYRQAAAEAGVEIDESSLESKYQQDQIGELLARLPDVLDQRISRHFDSRIENYSRQEQQAAMAAAQKAEDDRRLAYVSEKLDKFYAKHPDLKDFDRFIRPEVDDDPNVDLTLVAAPFMKLTSSKSARTRATTRSSVDVGGSDVSSSAASRQASPWDAGNFAGMGIDQIMAKLRGSV